MGRQSLYLCSILWVPGQVGPLVWIVAVIVEFLASSVVPDVAPPLGLYGVVVESESYQDRALPLLVRIFQKGYEALAIQAVPFWQAAQINERRIDVDQADRPMTELPLVYTFGH